MRKNTFLDNKTNERSRNKYEREDSYDNLKSDRSDNLSVDNNRNNDNSQSKEKKNIISEILDYNDIDSPNDYDNNFLDDDDDYDEKAIHKKVLMLHNKERNRLGLPSLKLDAKLCEVAQNWAEHLAKTKVSVHSRTEGLGECIAWRTPPGADVELLFKQWLDERQFFKNDVYPNIQTKKGEKVGHYSQIVWKDTTLLGVGYACNAKQTWLVCEYKVKGNIKGYKCY